MADEGLTSVHLFKSKLGADLRRSNSSPLSHSCSDNDMILVKVVFPSLDCSKIFKLNPRRVSYEPLVKFLTISKVDEEERTGFRLFTANGQVVNPGDSLLECNFKEKDTLMFKREDYGARRYTDTAGGRRMSTALMEGDRKYSLSSSLGDMRPMYIPTNSHHNGTALVPTNSDYWTTVSTFIGNFLKRRPPVSDLPRHVLEMMDAPLAPRSSVIVACLSYLRSKEAYTLEGIFRLSGLVTEVKAVCDSFKQETFDLDWVRNPHTVATALKQYCRVSAIIPPDVCATWANELRASEDGGTLDSVVKGIGLLPTENRFILSSLFSFLQLVLENQDSNKMAAHSLSVVWGPNLIHFHIPAMDAFAEVNIQATIMYTMLTHLDTLRLFN